MVCWHVGMGMGLYGVKALRLGYDQRQRVPRFFRPDDLNIPDVQQRVHWDPEWARRAGNPASYDYGRMRETWLIHLCTDWMGDDAWLWKLDCQFRKFNYVGDTHWMRGRVDAQATSPTATGRRSSSRSGARTSGARPRRPATRRSCCRAASTAPVRLPDAPGGADDLRRTRSPRSSTGSPRRGGHGMKAYPTPPDGLRRRARRRRCCAYGSTGPTGATRSPTTSCSRSSRRSRPPGSDESVRVIALTGTGDALLLRLRPRAARARATRKPRVGATQRQHAVARQPAHPDDARDADADRHRGDRLRRSGSGSTSCSRPTSRSSPTTPGSAPRSRRSASRPTRARRG